LTGPEDPDSTQAPARHGHRALWMTLGCVVVGGVAITIATVRHEAHAHAVAPVPPRLTIATAAVEQGDMEVHLQAIGTVVPVHTASITSQVTGMVEAVHFTEGQRVQKGDALLDIDARPYRATLQQAEGVLERDQNVLAQASMDLDRYRAAWARNAIAKQTLDDQEKIVRQNDGTVKNDLGTVQYDQVQVDFCHITAPIAGRVGLRLVDPGNVVQSNGNVVLAVVTQLEPITVVFTISEDELPAVRARLAQGAVLPVDALDRSGQKQIASGMLLTLDNQIDTTTGTVKARAQFDNKDDALFPNQFVNARLLVDTHHGVAKVPSQAIQQNGSGSFVYVIQGDVAHVRPVTLDVSDRGFTQVAGVAPGDVVATNAFDRLHEGAKVVVGPPAPPSPSGGASASPAPGGSAPP
jgi:multidrug efflux system membrane fusion protein